MSSPFKPSTKKTLAPNADIKELIIKTSHSQHSFDNLIQDDTLDSTIQHTKYVSQYNQDQNPEKYNSLNRLPTLYEILNRRTQSPVDLWSFYIYIRDFQNAVDYLDFWIDVVTHLRLCKDYVKGLRESLLLSEKHRSASDEKLLKLSDQTTSSEDKSGEARHSVSSSLLLEALLSEGFLDDKDNKRVSSFLQGNEYININDARINAIFGEHEAPQPHQVELTQPSPIEPEFPRQAEEDSELYPRQQRSQHSPDPYDPIVSPKRVFSNHKPLNSVHNEPSPNRASTKISPEQLEKYIANVKNGNITRATLKSSSRNILNTYFRENSPKRLVIPDRIIRKIRHDVEVQGRDDPDIFEDAKNYVYSAMERESLPYFLQQNALHNLNNSSALYRLIAGLFLLFAAFWISYCLIFVNVRPKAIRSVILIPFFLGVYFIVSFLYKLDPLMVFLGYSDNQELKTYSHNVAKKKRGLWAKNLREPFVKRLLEKRALWVLFLVSIISAALSVLFGLVPGHRI